MMLLRDVALLKASLTSIVQGYSDLSTEKFITSKNILCVPGYYFFVSGHFGREDSHQVSYPKILVVVVVDIISIVERKKLRNTAQNWTMSSTTDAEGKEKVALITGITGQDGSYLAELLLSKGYTVCRFLLFVCCMYIMNAYATMLRQTPLTHSFTLFTFID
jgi:GDP-mannose 4,6 dehydratase